MKEAKLLLLNSNKEIGNEVPREWKLKEDHTFLIGRKDEEGNVYPEIDLSFDNSISRKHAQIWFENGAWWIKHQGRFGTKINGNDIPQNENIKLKFDDKIIIGNKTTLILSPSSRETIRWEDSLIEVEVGDFLNYALLYNGLPFFKQIVFHNNKEAFSKSFSLRIKIGDFLDEEYKIPSIEIGESLYKDPEIKIDPNFFESQLDSTTSAVEIFIDDCPVYKKEIRILAYNEWSMERNDYHRVTLASFVQEQHPYVKEITGRLRERNNEIRSKDLPTILRALYDYFKDICKIEYVGEPISFSPMYQKIRLPHHIFIDWYNKVGAGTCIDLSLLFVSCLKNWGLHPLLMLFKIKEGVCHAIVGCWKEPQLLASPLIKEKEQIEKGVIILDPTCFTKNLSFDEAEKKAFEIFEKDGFLYAIDIDSARRNEIKSLPFTGNPKNSPEVIRVSLKAKKLAEEIGSKINYKVCTPIHLLVSLLMIGEGFTIEVFRRVGLGIEKSIKILLEGLENVIPPEEVKELTESTHYREVWALAFEKAKKEGVPSIYERHLFLALMEIPSCALNAAVEALGTTREKLIEGANSLLKKGESVRTKESLFRILKRENLLKSSLRAETILIPSVELEQEIWEAMFVLDICKSTDFLNKYGDEVFCDFVSIIGEILEYKGKQNQIKFLKSTGDGYFATFEEVDKALNVAFYSLKKLNEMKEESILKVDYPGVRIALNWGCLFIDRKGDRVDRIGKSVHLTFRLEEITEDQRVPTSWKLPPLIEKDRILITEDFYSKIENGDIKREFKYCGDFRLKGFEEPVKAYIYTGKII